VTHPQHDTATTIILDTAQDALGRQARLVNFTARDAAAAAAAAAGQPAGALVWAGPLADGDEVLVLVNPDPAVAVNVSVNLDKVFPAPRSRETIGVAAEGGGGGGGGGGAGAGAGAGAGEAAAAAVSALESWRSDSSVFAGRKFEAKDVWTGASVGVVTGQLEVPVPPHDVVFWRLAAL
jgi:hypothetical protein